MTLTAHTDDTLAMLRDSLARYLDDRHDFAQHLQALAGCGTAPPPFWRGLARDLDLLGAALPEAQGGLGGGIAAHLAIMETLGAALAAEPYLSAIVIGAGLLQRHPGVVADALLARTVAGDALPVLAHAEPQSRHERTHVQARLVQDAEGFQLDGHKAVVRAAPWATHFLVSTRSHGGPCDAEGVSLVCVPADAPGLRLRAYPLRDGVQAAELQFDAVCLLPDALLGVAGDAMPAIEAVLDEATLAVCAEAVGVLRRLQGDTLEYVRQRRQFGMAIAGFQALQHRLADMHLALAQAEALTASVGDQLAAGAMSADERARAVSSAKVAASQACRVVGQGAVQLHGGMGITEELAVGHCFRRATLIEGLFGPASWHLRRVARLSAGAGDP